MPKPGDPSEGRAGILTPQDEFEAWLAAPMEEARTLQRPLRDGALQVVREARRKMLGKYLGELRATNS